MLCYLHRKEATAVYAGVLRVCWAYCAGVLIGVFHEAFLTGGMGYSQLSWACPFLSSVGRLFFSSKNIFSLGGSQRARRECDVFLPFLSSSWRRLVVFSVFLCFPPIFHHMKYDRTMNLLPPLGRGKQKKNPSTIFCFCESSLHARTRPPFFFFVLCGAWLMVSLREVVVRHFGPLASAATHTMRYSKTWNQTPPSQRRCYPHVDPCGTARYVGRYGFCRRFLCRASSIVPPLFSVPPPLVLSVGFAPLPIFLSLLPKC